MAVIHCWGCKLLQPLWKLVRKLLKKKKTKLKIAHGPITPLLGTSLKDLSQHNAEELAH